MSRALHYRGQPRAVTRAVGSGRSLAFVGPRRQQTEVRSLSLGGACGQRASVRAEGRPHSTPTDFVSSRGRPSTPLASARPWPIRSGIWLSTGRGDGGGPRLTILPIYQRMHPPGFLKAPDGPGGAARTDARDGHAWDPTLMRPLGFMISTKVLRSAQRRASSRQALVCKN